MIKQNRMTWAGHIARIAEKRIGYKILTGNMKGSDYSKELDVYGRVILKGSS
jgi:hypothetical protein